MQSSFTAGAHALHLISFADFGKHFLFISMQFLQDIGVRHGLFMLLVPLFGSIIANSTCYVVSMGTVRQYGPRLFFLLFCECSIPDMG